MATVHWQDVPAPSDPGVPSASVIPVPNLSFYKACEPLKPAAGVGTAGSQEERRERPGSPLGLSHVAAYP